MTARGGEFGLIDAFLRPFGLSRGGRGDPVAGVILGPGDDCAQLRPSPGMRLVVTTDAVVEGVHFELRRSSAEDAGWKALAVNLSDLAAAGARPRWFVCALGVPRSAGAQAPAIARRLGAGMAEAARRFGIALVGGNVTGAGQWSLTVTAIGEARRPLSRAGGRPGDLLVLSGTTGAAALGLRLLQRARGGQAAAPRAGALRAQEQAVIGAQVRPWPQVAAGLAAAPLASAAIDVSDGLVQDLGHLCARSGAGAEVDCALLPRLPLVVRAEERAARAGAHRYALSLAGGEDYALLLAVRPARAEALLSALTRADAPWAVIGRLRRERGLRLRDGGKRLQPPRRGGFDHLAR